MLYGMADPLKQALVAHGPAAARLRAVRRADPRHGLPGAPAAGEHRQRVVPAGQASPRTCPTEMLLPSPASQPRRRREPRRDSSVTPTRRRDAGLPQRAAQPTSPRRAAARPMHDGAGRTSRAQLGRALPAASSAASDVDDAGATIDSVNPSHAERGRRHGAPRRAGAGRRRPWPPRATALPRLARHARRRARRSALRSAADVMRRRRFELAAWMVFEAASPGARPTPTSPRPSTSASTTPARCCGWTHARAGATCPARTTCTVYEPRGVAVVIAPWNFPLAILHRHDHRRPGRRQHRHHQAGRADRRSSPPS